MASAVSFVSWGLHNPHRAVNLDIGVNAVTAIRCRAASVVRPPPQDFDFRNEVLESSTAYIAESYPELFDLAESGKLVMIEKRQYGPVPDWRGEFVEPQVIWIIGTSHISQESASHVERVIRAVKPENIVVELCKSRAGIMYTDEKDNQKQKLSASMFSLTGNGFLGAVSRSVNLGGQTALALRLLLATLSSKLSSEINQPFGEEFRAARRACEEIGAQLVLGDRPIEITLGRAWNSLTWKEKLSLVSAAIRGITSTELSKKALEESRDENSHFQLYEQLSHAYPPLLPSLIHERDVFLAWSLKRSKAVNKSKNVVGVMGRGHMNGVIYSLISDQGNLRFRDLTGNIPRTESSSWLVSLSRDLLRDTLIGYLLWLLYEQLKPLSQ